MHPALARFTASLSTAGLLIGTLFFAASLTPSLLPRPYGLQGVLSGLSFAAGYGIGVFGRWLWMYLELPLPGTRGKRIWLWTVSLPCAAAVLLALHLAAEWQNSIRLLMELDPVDSAHPFRVGAIALLVFVAVLALARLFHLTYRIFAARLKRFIPRRVAHATSVFLAALLFGSVINGVLFQCALRVADSSFQEVDARILPEVQPPADFQQAGSPESLVAWEELGRRGREFVASGPTREQLSRFLEAPAREPIRVYVGLNAAETPEERARLALEELQRVGGFERSVLIVVTPTGTGWIDPKALDPLEYLHRGDVASVAVQYSYLPSWLSLMVEPDYGADTATALFDAVYGHWARLPRERRPRLYLHGLSLGALHSERSADLWDVIADPFSGALWAGPPFRSATWRTLTALREPRSPAWLPRFRDGSVVRFANQHEGLDAPDARWGPMRIVYLQYASDPITFFEPRALYRSPEWMNEPRGPDVSEQLRWFPVVTMLQLAVDIAAGNDAPRGYGHVYAPGDYLRAWRAVTAPEGWSEEALARLERHFAD